MLEVYSLIERVRDTKTTVMILGESGVGKEKVAQAIHYGSNRADKPFVAINCAALPESLIESELFGYERGAFTGAVASRKGRFELADGGTLFLDEMGDLPYMMQIKLLRVIQERSVRADRRHVDHYRGRPDHHRDEPGPGGPGAGGEIQGGPLLPP